MKDRLTMLMILDGFGINTEEKGNAIKIANIPNINKLMETCPKTEIYTSGLNVGLPEGQMGNSEVGHTNIGAGRIVYQELTRITKSIEDGDFFSIKEFNDAIENCKKYGSKLHIMGLLSDGGVHSHIRHLFGLLEACKRKGFEDVYIHAFMDGRDTPPASRRNVYNKTKREDVRKRYSEKLQLFQEDTMRWIETKGGKE
jgi:2,3-bisphosphoglycerate-independent phosphoglycerate mutase